MHSRIYNWHYETEPEPELDNRRIYWPRGKALGGTSTINGMSMSAATVTIMTAGSKWGCRVGATPRSCPISASPRVTRSGLRPVSRRSGAAVRLPRAWREPAFRHLYRGRAPVAGHAVNDDFNGVDQEGFGRYDFTIRDGKRCSTSKAFLRPIRDWRNLTVETHALTEQIVIEKERAIGVRFRQRGQSRRVNARREIILCAGAANSPQILMMSGIGNGDEIARHGIAPAPSSSWRG